MTRIRGLGTYVPFYRIQRSSIGEQFGDSDRGGETAVPNHDEDVVTMALSAAEHALESCAVDGTELDAVFSASVSSPFAERGTAGEIAHALGANGNIRVADFRSSARAVTAAIETSRDAIRAGEVQRALVVASDALPPGEPGTASERTAGAGAGALLLDASGSLADIVEVVSETTGFPDPVRHTGEGFSSGHNRFNRVRFVETVQTLLDRTTGPLDRIAISSPHEGWSDRAHRRSDCDAPLDSTFDVVGNVGTASFVLDTALAFRELTRGERVGVISYGGGGGSLLVFEAGDEVGDAPTMTLQEQLDNKEYVSYAKHRSYRHGVP